MIARSRNGISPIVASVLLIAFTMAVAGLTGPWVTNLIQGTQSDVSDDTDKVTDASLSQLEVFDAKYDEDTGNLTVTIKNKGNTELKNFTATVAEDDEFVQKQVNKKLNTGEIHTFEVSTDSPESVEIASENLAVEAEKDLTETESESTGSGGESGSGSGDSGDGGTTADLSVQSVSLTNSQVDGEETGYEVTVENTGDAEGDYVAKTVSSEVDINNTKTETIAASSTKTFTVNTSGLSTKAGTYTVEFKDENTSTTQSNTVDATLTLEDFEQQNLDAYSGDKTHFSTSTSTVYEGSRVLHFQGGTGQQAITRTDKQIGRGSEFKLRLYPDNMKASTGMLFGVQSETGISSLSGYGVGIEDKGGANRVDIIKYESGSRSVIKRSEESGVPSNEWLKYEIDWKSDGEIIFTLYDSSGSQIEKVNVTDTTYTSGGIGWIAHATDTSDQVYADKLVQTG